MTPLHSSWKVVSRRPTTGDLTPQILSGANEFIQTKEITVAAVNADLETLAELYRTLKTNVETTNTIQTQVDGSVNSAVWESTNATKFREQWTTQFKPALKALEDALAEAGTDVANNHNNLAISGGESVEHLSPVSPIA
ncbi:hypothetical protein [uncultured Actinomyces sp.]|uniref:hypothetical protein n=1 Tax=uncultured Actinomyces sp. TaxID=249061 RepID=UPI0028D480C0|nr:hypothetical protein [uncultured Actinomyces sp.]